MKDELQKVIAAVQAAYHQAGLDWPPQDAAPTKLWQLIDAQGSGAHELPNLTARAIWSHLMDDGINPQPLKPDDQPLAGFLFVTHGHSWLYVNRNDPVPRRRFTAAHELGHFIMHWPEAPPDAPYIISDDAGAATIREEELNALTTREREANRFAAELLMPSNVVRRLHDHYWRRFGPTPRFIEHHLASDLLVSREAVRWRLVALGLSEAPPCDDQRPVPAPPTTPS